MTGYVIAVIGDTHIGSSTALSPLQFTIHNRNTLEEQATHANRLQEWLHECWVDYWDYVFHLCGKGKKGKRLIVIHLGDVIDGNHKDQMAVMLGMRTGVVQAAAVEAVVEA